MNDQLPQVKVDRATENDLGHAVLCLGGIFWALDQLVVEKAANEITTEDDRSEGIASLIAAGKLLAKEVWSRT